MTAFLASIEWEAGGATCFMILGPTRTDHLLAFDQHSHLLCAKTACRKACSPRSAFLDLRLAQAEGLTEVSVAPWPDWTPIKVIHSIKPHFAAGNVRGSFSILWRVSI